MPGGSTRRGLWSLIAGLPFVGTILTARARAQSPTATVPVTTGPIGATGRSMLTVFLRHDETKTVDEINRHLQQTGWFRDFPPPGVEVVSWYVMMEIRRRCGAVIEQSSIRPMTTATCIRI
jgi:hypothetical protein